MTSGEGLEFVVRWLVLMAVIAIISYGGTAIYRRFFEKKRNHSEDDINTGEREQK